MFKFKFLSVSVITAILIATAPLCANAASQNTLNFSVIKQQLVLKKNDIQSVKRLPEGNRHSGVTITLTPKAAKKLNALTANNINQQLQLSVGDHIVNRGTIRSALGKKLQITTKTQNAEQKLLHALS